MMLGVGLASHLVKTFHLLPVFQNANTRLKEHPFAKIIVLWGAGIFLRIFIFTFLVYTIFAPFWLAWLECKTLCTLDDV